jgi:hypothetical protein
MNQENLTYSILVSAETSGAESAIQKLTKTRTAKIKMEVDDKEAIAVGQGAVNAAKKAVAAAGPIQPTFKIELDGANRDQIKRLRRDVRRTLGSDPDATISIKSGVTGANFKGALTNKAEASEAFRSILRAYDAGLTGHLSISGQSASYRAVGRMTSTGRAIGEEIEAAKPPSLPHEGTSKESIRQAWLTKYRLMEGDQSKEGQNWTKYWEALKKSSHEALVPLTAVQKSIQAFGQGGLRRSFATLFTAALGGGPVASIVGGMGGAIASAIALPIAWAIGNALMELPQLLATGVVIARHRRELGVSDSQGPGGPWEENIRPAMYYWGQYRTGKGELMAEGVMEAAFAAQRAGPLPGGAMSEQALAEASARATNQAAALAVGRRIGDKQGMADFASTMAALDEPMSVDAARKKILQDPALRAFWKRQFMPNSPATVAMELMESELRVPQYSLDKLRDRPGGKSGTTAAETLKWMVGAFINEDPRTQGEWKAQAEEWHLRPQNQYLYKNAPPVARAYMDQVAAEERARRNPSTDVLNPSGSPGAVRAMQDYHERLAELRGEGLTDADRARLKPYGIAMGGGELALPGLGVGVKPKTEDFIPGQASWTSATGLAETMQTMWSGIPALDQLGSAGDKLNSAGDKMLEASQDMGIFKWMLDILPNIQQSQGY